MVTALLCLAFGGALGWFIAQARAAATHERARLLTLDLEAARLRLTDLETKKSKIENELSAERAAATEKIGALTDAHERLTNSFKALSADALRSNNQSFLELARETFGKLHQQSTDDLGKRQQAIDSLVKPLKESLEKVDAKIGEIEKARAGAYSELSTQLKSLGTAQISLQAEAAKLTTALRSTTTAGTWGELQLRRVVELSGMSSYCDFTEQQTSGGFRPDLIVRLPGGQQVVIDAKAPNDAYREAVNSSDDQVRSAKLAEHAAKVREYAVRLAPVFGAFPIRQRDFHDGGIHTAREIRIAFVSGGENPVARLDAGRVTDAALLYRHGQQCFDRGFFSCCHFS